jgi:hypothetical protein
MNQQLVVFMYVLEYLMYRYKREAGGGVVVVVHGIDIESNIIVDDNEDDAVLV